MYFTVLTVLHACQNDNLLYGLLPGCRTQHAGASLARCQSDSHVSRCLAGRTKYCMAPDFSAALARISPVSTMANKKLVADPLAVRPQQGKAAIGDTGKLQLKLPDIKVCSHSQYYQKHACKRSSIASSEDTNAHQVCCKVRQRMLCHVMPSNWHIQHYVNVQALMMDMSAWNN